jgi:hypothetical protein
MDRARSLVSIWAVAALAGLAGAGPAAADEISTFGAARGLVIHDATETLNDYCHEHDGALWLRLPGGAP